MDADAHAAVVARTPGLLPQPGGMKQVGSLQRGVDTSKTAAAQGKAATQGPQRLAWRPVPLFSQIHETWDQRDLEPRRSLPDGAAARLRRSGPK